MTKFNSLARARVIGPESGAWGGGASGDAREGATGVDVLVVSSSCRPPPGDGPLLAAVCNLLLALGNGHLVRL